MCGFLTAAGGGGLAPQAPDRGLSLHGRRLFVATGEVAEPDLSKPLLHDELHERLTVVERHSPPLFCPQGVGPVRVYIDIYRYTDQDERPTTTTGLPRPSEVGKINDRPRKRCWRGRAN